MLRISITLASLALTLAGAASSQILSFGITGGIPITDAFPNDSGAYERRYIIGPTAEIHLPLHFSFEVDALYRRSGYSSTFSTYAFGGPPFPPVEVVERSTLNDWQIPFLAKWTAGSWVLKPFVDGGVTYRHLSGQSTAQTSSGGTSAGVISGPAILNPNTAGIAAGAGLTVKLLVLRVSPEIRYTHWVSTSSAGVFLPTPTNANQADVLVGITF